jgi:5-methylcytosine-specific restriction protein A
MAERTRPAWDGSTRRERLPDNWTTEIVPAVFAEYGDTCHVCQESGADEVDHVIRGDDHSLQNLRPIHGWRTPQGCHKKKSSQEGAAARPRLARPAEPHPAFQ